MPDSTTNKLSTSAAEVIPPAVLLAAIVDSSDDAIVSKNLHGIVTSWNKGAEQIFGYAAEEMIGESITRLLLPTSLDEEARILERLHRGERIDHYETVRVRKDGRQIDVALTISPVRNSNGEIVGASKIARDITEQKLAVAKLAQAHEDLKRADRIKSEFISTLSHELRTPLTAIAGWLEIMRDGGTDELAEGIEVIGRNVRLQTKLIEDLLDMSRIESGKIALDFQRLDLSAVVNAAIESVIPTATAKDIRLTSAVSSMGALVMADKSRLHQIIWNLLANAIKFTPKGGCIHVTIERLNSHVEIAVTDTGSGIAPEFLTHIFERFRQADASTTRRHGGLGLGLAIVKNLVELHGGSVRAHSEGAGRGATFTVSLPLLAIHAEPERIDLEKRNAALDEVSGCDDLSGVKVLVVDDDTDTAGAIRRILARRSATVRTAGSMNEALSVFDEFAPHIVLSDISMPDHDGYELISSLRALPGGRTVPAIALTALARSEDRARALRAGFQVHAAKPVDASELVAMVHNLACLRGSER